MPNNGKPALPANFIQQVAEKDFMLAKVYIEQFENIHCRINPIHQVLQTRIRPGKGLPKKGGWHRPTFEQFRAISQQMMKEDLQDGEQPLG